MRNSSEEFKSGAAWQIRNKPRLLPHMTEVDHLCLVSDAFYMWEFPEFLVHSLEADTLLVPSSSGRQKDLSVPRTTKGGTVKAALQLLLYNFGCSILASPVCVFVYIVLF